MKINISETIKKLRKEKNITQAELAANFGVTCQSVCRWENGAAYPDIELIPEIAAYFGVTTDVLLGCDKESVESKISEVYSLENTKDRLYKLTELIGKYPNELILLKSYIDEALFLSVEPNFDSNDPIFVSAIGMADKYITICRDAGKITKMKTEKIRLLCLTGRFAEAKTLAMDFEAPIVNEQMYLADICKYTEEHNAEIKHRQESIARILGFLADEIDKLGHAYMNNKEYENAIDVYQIVLSLSNVTHNGCRFHAPLQNWSWISGFYMAECFIELKRYDEAVDVLERTFDDAVIQCECMSSYESLTTPLLSKIDLTPYHGDVGIKDIVFPFEHPDFICLHNNPRFRALMERYNESCISASNYDRAKEAVRLYPDNYRYLLYLADAEYQLAFEENINHGSLEYLNDMTDAALVHYEIVISNSGDNELIRSAVIGKVLTLRFLERIEEADWSAEFEYPDKSITTAEQIMQLTERGKALAEFLINENS